MKLRKLQKIKEIKGTIEVVTGLHIGAGKDSIEIGGVDQPIIKDPVTNAPYIPGSSIKGKMRSLLEISGLAAGPETAKFLANGDPCMCGKHDCPSCAIFGASAEKRDKDLGPTRLIVRDARLSREWKEKFAEDQLNTEVKYENTIDRIQGVAEHPRSLERIPAGVEFDFSLSLKVFEGDSEKLQEIVLKGLKLIELDALGGNSSRGCGQVRFTNLTCESEKVELPAVF